MLFASLKKLPSPIGESYFSIERLWLRMTIKQFPSPIGESYFSIDIIDFIQVDKLSFRPLSGNLIFQCKWKYLQEVENGVSVPYRGILFFNKKQADAMLKTLPVSVPYRGILFFNRLSEHYHICWISFPSPIGESYFSILLILLVSVKRITFPSPIGESYFSMLDAFVRAREEFPSPIGESYFSIIDSADIGTHFLCFRPLSGNLIFQFKQEYKKARANYVSVPYRGILFFNFFVFLFPLFDIIVSVPYRGILFFNTVNF